MRQYLAQALPDELIEAGRVDGAQHAADLLARRRPGRPAGDGGARHADLRDGLERLLLADHRAHLAEPDGPGRASRAWPRGYAPEQSVIMAGTLLGTLPLLIALRVLGKQIVGGIMQGAVKG